MVTVEHVKSPFCCCFLNQRRLLGEIRAGGSCRRVGGTVENTLKRGGTEKRGGETKIFKKGQAGSRGRCLKKVGGAGTSSQTMRSALSRYVVALLQC